MLVLFTICAALIGVAYGMATSDRSEENKENMIEYDPELHLLSIVPSAEEEVHSHVE